MAILSHHHVSEEAASAAARDEVLDSEDIHRDVREKRLVLLYSLKTELGYL